MASEIIDYMGHRLEISPVLKGWRVSIYPRGSKFALPESPSMLETSAKEVIVAQAKRIVDARIESQGLRSNGVGVRAND